MQEVVLGALEPDTSYSVSVGAYTARGDGARSTPLPVCSGLPRRFTHLNEDLGGPGPGPGPTGPPGSAAAGPRVGSSCLSL